MKLPSDKHLTCKTYFLLVLASAKKVSELLSLSCQVRHSKGWRSFTFSFFPVFIAKTVCDPKFEEFTIPSLADFVDGDRVNNLCFSLMSLILLSISDVSFQLQPDFGMISLA